MSGLLIVDDDRTIVRIFERCFEASNIAVYAAASGAEGLKLPERCCPTLSFWTWSCRTKADCQFTMKSAGFVPKYRSFSLRPPDPATRP